MGRRIMRRFATSGQVLRLTKLKVKPSVLLASSALFAGVMSGGLVMNQPAYANGTIATSNACFLNVSTPNDYYCYGTEGQTPVLTPDGEFSVDIANTPDHYNQTVDVLGAAFTINAGQWPTVSGSDGADGIHMESRTYIVNEEGAGMRLNVTGEGGPDYGVDLNIDQPEGGGPHGINGGTNGLEVYYTDTETGFTTVYVNNNGHVEGGTGSGIYVDGGGSTSGSTGLNFNLNNQSYDSDIGAVGLTITNQVNRAQVGNFGGLIAGLTDEGLYVSGIDHQQAGDALEVNNDGVGIIIGATDGAYIEDVTGSEPGDVSHPLIDDNDQININNGLTYSYSDPSNVDGTASSNGGGLIAGLGGDGIELNGLTGAGITGNVYISNWGTRGVLVNADSLGLDGAVYNGETGLVDQISTAAGLTDGVVPLGIYGTEDGIDAHGLDSTLTIDNGAHLVTQAFGEDGPENLTNAPWVSGGGILGFEGDGVAAVDIGGSLFVNNGIYDYSAQANGSGVTGGLIIGYDNGDGIYGEDIAENTAIDNGDGTVYGDYNGIELWHTGYDLSSGDNGAWIYNGGGQIIGSYGDGILVATEGEEGDNRGVQIDNGEFGDHSNTANDGSNGGVILGSEDAIEIWAHHDQINNGDGGAIIGSGFVADIPDLYLYFPGPQNLSYPVPEFPVINLHTEDGGDSNIYNRGLISSYGSEDVDLPHFTWGEDYSFGQTDTTYTENAGYTLDVAAIDSDVNLFSQFAWSGGQQGSLFNPDTGEFGTSLSDYQDVAGELAIVSQGQFSEDFGYNPGGALHVGNDYGGVLIGRVLANGGGGEDGNSISNFGAWYVQDGPNSQEDYTSDSVDSGPYSALDINSQAAVWLTGAGSYNGVDNAGLIQTAFNSEELEVATFRLGSLNNGAYYDQNTEDLAYSDGLISSVDGGVGDLIHFVTNSEDLEESTAFHGSVDGADTSFIGLDVNFAPADPEFADGETDGGNWQYPDEWRADRFDIWGTIDGSTGLIVNNINPGSTDVVGDSIIVGSAGYDNGPTEDGTGPLKDGDTVYIASQSAGYIDVGGIGAIQDGLYAWYLYRSNYDTPLPEATAGITTLDEPQQQDQSFNNEDVDYVLVSDWAPQAFLLPSLITGAQNVWYDTAGVVEDHVYGNHFPTVGEGGSGADLAPGATPAEVASAPLTSIWGKITGSQFTRDTTVTDTIGGTPVDIDTGLVQNTFSMLAGADFQPDGSGSGLRVGVYGAYDKSNLDFSSYDASATYEGGSLGAYAAYTNANGFYVDAEGKMDWLDLDYTSGVLDASATATSFGVLANSGYRMQMGSTFIEPIVSAAYVNTAISSMGMSGTTVDFSNGQSFRAGAGARVGTTVALNNDVSAEFSVLGKIWNEFEPANQVTITDSIGDETTFEDNISGVFGEVAATATVYNTDKSFSGFVSVNDKFNSTFSEVGGKVGIRKSF